MKMSGGSYLVINLVLGTIFLDKHVCLGEKILVVSFISTKSHKLTYMPLVEELGKRGHNITVLTPIKATKEAKNVKEILTLDGENLQEKLLKELNLDVFKMKEKNKPMNPFSMSHWFDGVCRDTYDLPHVRAIMEDSFDLILMQPMCNDCALGLVYRLGAPLVLFSPVSAPGFVVDKIGLHFPSSVVPNILMDLPTEMDFYQRFLNFGFDVMLAVTIKFYYQPAIHAIFKDKVGDDVPTVNEILANTSLILSNGHFSLHGHKPLTPDVLEVGGLHSRPAKPLPKDLEDFIGIRKNGFILFSMGSAIKGDTMPDDKRQMFLNVFSKLKQQVVWKWESEWMPGVPTNVKLSKWLPQQDLLGHKDIKMFISHCGGGSIEEAVYHGVPLIGLPMIGDQLANAKLAKRHDFIVELDWNTVTEDELLDAINEVLKNSKYSKNVKKLSEVFKDQPEDPLTRAIYWVEYVIRHKGAPHLRSGGKQLNYFQYHSYDVILAYVAILFVILYVSLKILHSVFYLMGQALFRNKKDVLKSRTKKMR